MSTFEVKGHTYLNRHDNYNTFVEHLLGQTTTKWVIGNVTVAKLWAYKERQTTFFTQINTTLFKFGKPTVDDNTVPVFKYTSDKQLVACIEAFYTPSARIHVNSVNTHYDHRRRSLCRNMFDAMFQ